MTKQEVVILIYIERDIDISKSMYICRHFRSVLFFLQIPHYRILLLLFTHGNPKSQKYFLGAVEKLIELKKEQLLPKVPVILKVRNPLNTI